MDDDGKVTRKVQSMAESTNSAEDLQMKDKEEISITKAATKSTKTASKIYQYVSIALQLSVLLGLYDSS